MRAILGLVYYFMRDILSSYLMLAFNEGCSKSLVLT
jgi:hypothetical protein